MIFTAADSAEMIATPHDSDVTWSTNLQESRFEHCKAVAPKGGGHGCLEYKKTGKQISYRTSVYTTFSRRLSVHFYYPVEV